MFMPSPYLFKKDDEVTCPSCRKKCLCKRRYFNF